MTLALLIPPDLDYKYFQFARAHPFEHAATGYSKVNAAWLADAALLVYARESDATARFDSEMSQTATAAPWRTNALAITRPMPDPAAVTRTCFLVSLCMARVDF